MSVQTTITRQDPAIEAYRLGLLGDVQGLVRNQMFGQQVQNLRGQGLNDEEIAARLSIPAQGTEGEEGYVPGTAYSADQIGQVSPDAQFAPPDYQVAGLSQNQTDAANLAARGVGSYQPFVEGGLQGIQQGQYTTGQGIEATMQGLNVANQFGRQGMADIRGAGAQAQNIAGRFGQGIQSAAAGATPGLQASTFGGLRDAQIAQNIAGQGLGFARLGTQGAMADLQGSSSQAAMQAARTGRQLGQIGRGAQDIAAQARMGGQNVLGRQAMGLARAEDTMGQNVARGQAQMGEAVDRARASTGRATDALYGAGDASRGIAADVTGRARGLQDPLEGRLLGSTAGGLGEAQRGQIGADEAARLARLSTARSQEQLGRAAEFGMGTAQSGIAGLMGASAEFNPYSAYQYMNPFEDVAVQQALRDIQRQGDIQAQNVAAQAVQSGAFGGSRQAVAEAELGRNVLEQQGRTAAQMRQAGFESAGQRAQTAFEQARQRQIAAAQTTGQLGQAGAGTSAQAAQAAGQLGLGAEQLAQTGALQGAQLGLSSRQFEAANAKAIADTGLSIEQLASQTGLQAQQIAGNFAQAAGQMGLQTEQMAAQTAERAANLGMTEAQFQAANQQALASTGMNVEQLSAQTGMNAQQLAGQLTTQAGQMGMDAARIRQAGAQQAGALSQGLGSLMGSTATNMGQLGLSARQQQAANAAQQAQLGMTAAQQAGALGLQGTSQALQAGQAAGQMGMDIGRMGFQAGQQFGNLGAQQAQMGIQQAGLGELEQAMRNRDVSSLMQTGGMLQAQDQSVLDATRLSNMQRYQQPFQQLGFLSDVYAGIPTSQSTQTMTSGSSASPFMQAATLGIAGLSAATGAQNAGIL